MSVHSVAYGSFHHIQSSRKFPDHQSRELETLHAEKMNREETPNRINPCVPTITSTPSACSYTSQEKRVQKIPNSILLAVKHIARHLSQHLAIVFAHVVDLLHQKLLQEQILLLQAVVLLL
jgi:hypothetical protein